MLEEEKKLNNKYHLSMCITGVIIMVFFIMMTCSYQLRFTELAVSSLFGKIVPKTISPGLHWRLPWPIEKIYKYDARIQIFSGTFSETYTADGKNIILSLFAGWRISKPQLFLETIGSKKEAVRVLEGLIRSAKNTTIGKHPLNHLISTNPEQLQFENIENEILVKIQKTASEQYGVKVESLGIEKMALPESITKNIFERMRKERELIAGKYRAQGERKATDIKAKADRQKNEILSNAKSQAKRIRGEGDTQAAKYYATFDQDPEFALFLRKIEAFETTLKKKTTLILDSTTPPYDLFKSSGLKEKKNEK